ncbi:LysM peptidoglycan-binding domain-containing protein [Aneurinibacillus aneurinilyticus]|uniref:LysM peptidoglycan-binding domain-containing protein n=1 Tax=Aneurinibacillus aneurinilyticus TaxID=1391 RepID=UPI002E218489|nr:LysM peptidoglycan-binding domain-containing protein [Aneurinibacillus aneurinilyticus]
MQDNQDAILTFPVQHSIFISPDQSEIEQIDEIELTPHIQIKETTEEVIVSGYLMLEGKYAGKPPKFPDISLDDPEVKVTGYVDTVVFNPFAMDPDDFEAENELTPFTEKIPVHICISRNKIEDVGQIYASITSFDYDVQSARKLAIMAELALNGVRSEAPAQPGEEHVTELPRLFEYVASRQEEEEEETEQITGEASIEETELETEIEAEEYIDEQPKIEPITFKRIPNSDIPVSKKEETTEIKETEAKSEMLLINMEIEKQNEEADKRQIEQVKAEEMDKPQIDQSRAKKQSLQPQDVKTKEEPTNIQQTTAEPRQPQEGQTKVTERQKELEPERPQNQAEETEEHDRPMDTGESVDEASPAEEKEEAKVSITLKGTKRDPVTVTTSLLSSYAQRETTPNAQQTEAEKMDAREEETEESRENESNETERKEGALYLTSFMRQEKEEFTRLKMCIAQQDETLDGIAEKYNVTPADIAMANGLHTNATVAKGQVLYIPVKS